MSNINNKVHCSLCEHSVYDNILGSRCKDKGQEKNFRWKCPNYLPDEKLERKILSYYKRLELYKKDEVFNYINAIAYMVGGVLSVLAAYFIYQMIFRKGFFAILPVFIAGTGLTLFAKGIGAFVALRRDKKTFQEEHKEIVSFLEIYEMEDMMGK